MADQPGQLTASEQARLDRLRSYAILDTPRETFYDRFVFSAAQVFRAPIAMLTLVDADRLWCKALVGQMPSERPRHLSFCSYAIASAEPMVIDDATQDARFKSNLLVIGEPYVRFYASAPLIARDGLRIGCLSVIDRAPRSPLPKQVWNLVQLAREAMEGIEARRVVAVDR